ncbi:MAG: PEP-CTERM sorting domain-containing protein [Methylococcaceae bacterium]|nr:PEP-CTERM sorting domain-containing protein [Methylococcaceae bacterium]
MNTKNTVCCLIPLLSSVMVSPTTMAATQVFSGTGAAATTEFTNFQTAIKNATTVTGNKISWDGVKLDGTDANPNTKVIDQGKTVQIPVDRFKNVGAIFADPYTVSGDGFASVNPATAGQFPAFSPNNTFAMFDAIDGQFEDRKIQQSFVLPNTVTTAGTRGFGAIFVDVEQANSSSIEYFGKDASNNKISIGKYYVKPSANGEPQFLGVLYDAAVVSEIEVTVGSKALFSFDGKVVKPFGAENLAQSIDLVMTDDFFFAVPEQLQTSTDPTPIVNCLLNWAERNYSNYFSPTGNATQTLAPYLYRYYPNNNAYLGVSANDQHVYYLSYGTMQDVGPASYWYGQAKCQ